MYRIVNETNLTCPYWIPGIIEKKLTIIYGCGGYGEVSVTHPAAGSQICNSEARICKRCAGTGILRPIVL